MTSNALRKLGVLLAVLMVASVAFTGGALADQENEQDTEAENTNSQAAAQSATVNQAQSQTGGNVVGDQTQAQAASVDQDINQAQSVTQTNDVDPSQIGVNLDDLDLF